MTLTTDLDARWAERDRRREADERHFEQQRREHRDHHVAIVEEALKTKVPAGGEREAAEAAVDSLLDAGVVFTYMGLDGPS